MMSAARNAAEATVDLSAVETRLGAAVAAGLLSGGLAHRVRLTTRLAATLPQEGTGHCPNAVSGEALGRSLGLSRAAVNKHAHHLRTLGFAVVSIPGSGYRLERPFSDLVAAEAVLPFLLGRAGPEPGRVAGLPYLYVSRCDSTNVDLKEAMSRRAGGGMPSAGTPPAGALVVTDEQTGGRGRLDRTWSSQLGKDLTFSVLLRPSLVPGQAHLLSLVAALSVAEVLETLPGLEGRVAVKWPNDVLLEDRKVCGILLEGSMDADRLHWAVAGIGLNVNSISSALVAALGGKQADAWAGRPRPVSLRERLGRDVPRAPLLASLLERLGERWAALEDQSSRQDGAQGARDPDGEHHPGAVEVITALRQRDALAGRRVEVYSGAKQPELVVAGEAAGIGPEGQLLVRRPSGEMSAVFAGDVTLGSARGGATAGAP
jgi:BirA family biotin operon repressor/biotin-[acetyl-CoA-carboxylase] ligase